VPPSIIVENLRFRYSSAEVLHGISFEIAPGEVTGLLGPNGAGKSTTLKILTGILAPGSGRVEVHGFSLPDQARELKQRIGYVPEAAELYETLSAHEFLQLCGRLHDLEDSSLLPRIDALLEAFELVDHGHSELGSFSKGMRQKVLISAALLHNPAVIFLDEPLTGLDVESAVLVKTLLGSLAAQGRTVLYSSHVLDVVERICARAFSASGDPSATSTPRSMMRTRAQTRSTTSSTCELYSTVLP